MERDIDHLAQLESVNSGKGVRIVREVDITDSIACLRYYAGFTDKIYGDVIPVDDQSKLVYTRKEPIGVVGQIVSPALYRLSL